MKRFAAGLALVLAIVPASEALAFDSDAMLKVATDQARVLKIDRPAETVIIGNPAIVDVTIHDASTLVLTGRSYGVTNLVVLDARGNSIVDEQVIVTSNELGTVRVYRQAQRVTFACSPECEPTVTIGDDGGTFDASFGQFQTRQSMAVGAAK
ncbi:pilus assembly protein CpaC [Aureimonas sp. Leaf460]|nr:pilus assembly protein CpaC [Aureimonas sp. Leaf427]KQT71786.1 pilus assembly protein CpaC [Aureimonas sp. Leaf460]